MTRGPAILLAVLLVTAVSLHGQTAQPWETGTYVYDGAGNVKSIGTDQFRYDALGRVRSGTAGPGRTQSATYDAYGNVLTMTTDGTTLTFGVNPSTNRLTQTGFNVYGTYDAAGRLENVAGNGNSFVWDGAGAVMRSTVDGTTKVHLYSATDERVASVTIAGGAETRSDWTIRGPGGNVLRRLEKTGTQWKWKEDYVYRGSQILASDVDTPDQVLHFFPDHLGSTRLITGNGGMKVSQHTYFPFGAEATAAGPADEKVKFAGHERDAATLDYMHARYYATTWGRFLSTDPVMNIRRASKSPQQWNRYSYAANNPLKYIDPDGREITISAKKNSSGSVDVSLRITIELFHRSGPPINVAEAKSAFQGAANILSGTFKAAGHNPINVTTTLDVIITKKGGTDDSRHQMALDPDAVPPWGSRHNAEMGGNQMNLSDLDAKWLAHEMGHWLGLENIPEPDPRSADGSPDMDNLMTDDGATTELTLEQWLEVLRAYRERELNQGIHRKMK